MRPRVFLLVVLAIALVPVATASAQAGNRCSDRFAGSVFDTGAAAGPVQVYGSGITQALLDRYADDWSELVELVQEEMGGLDGGVTVCVFAGRLPIDAEALGWPRNLQLRAIAYGQEQLVVVSSWLIGETPDAGRNGLLHVAEYQVSAGTYPEPFGNEVKGWYRNRVDRTVENIHNVLVRQNSGLSEPWQPFPWTVGQMVDPLLWNPEIGYGGGGDFANYAAATAGNVVLSDPLGSDLDALDEGWRQTLFDESGAIPGGSRGWMVGLFLSMGLLLLGIYLAWSGRHQKRKIEEKMRDLEWLEQMSREAREREAVRTSVAGGGGRRDARVRRRRSNPAGVDGDDGDGAPTGGTGRSGGDRMTRRTKPGDDVFRHPGFDEDD
jgi:hypothetical protein